MTNLNKEVSSEQTFAMNLSSVVTWFPSSWLDWKTFLARIRDTTLCSRRIDFPANWQSFFCHIFCLEKFRAKKWYFTQLLSFCKTRIGLRKPVVQRLGKTTETLFCRHSSLYADVFDPSLSLLHTHTHAHTLYFSLSFWAWDAHICIPHVSAGRRNKLYDLLQPKIWKQLPILLKWNAVMLYINDTLKNEPR